MIIGNRSISDLIVVAKFTIPLFLAAYCAGGLLDDEPITVDVPAQLAGPGLKVVTADTIPPLLIRCHTGTCLRNIPITEAVHHVFLFQGCVTAQPDPAKGRSAPLDIANGYDLINPDTGIIIDTCQQLYEGIGCRPDRQAIASAQA